MSFHPGIADYFVACILRNCLLLDGLEEARLVMTSEKREFCETDSLTN